MAHPDLVLLAHFPQAVEQRAFILDLDEGAAEFATVAAAHRAAELVHQRLLAVADAKQRAAALEDGIGNAWAVLVEHRGRGSREDYAHRVHPLEGFFRGVEGCDFGVDAGLPHAAGDQLGHLAAEVDDQDGFGGLDIHGGPLVSDAISVQPARGRACGIFSRAEAT